MAAKQVKSRQRVADHGEVFTAEREVKAMCDLVKQETERIDSRFLEPACGDGNFLAEVLSRKLSSVTKKYKKSPFDWERNAILALSSIYGVDLLQDNCLECRDRLYDLWNSEYSIVCRKEANEDTRKAAKVILTSNIVCGNALSFMCVDEKQQDTDVPIIFPEWTFPNNDAFIQRRDFRFDVLLRQNDNSSNYETVALFADAAVDSEFFEIDPDNSTAVIPKPIKEYPMQHYRRLGING